MYSQRSIYLLGLLALVAAPAPAAVLTFSSPAVALTSNCVGGSGTLERLITDGVRFDLINASLGGVNRYPCTSNPDGWSAITGPIDGLSIWQSDGGVIEIRALDPDLWLTSLALAVTGTADGPCVARVTTEAGTTAVCPGTERAFVFAPARQVTVGWSSANVGAGGPLLTMRRVETVKGEPQSLVARMADIVVDVPEPWTWAMLSLGLLAWRRRK